MILKLAVLSEKQNKRDKAVIGGSLAGSAALLATPYAVKHLRETPRQMQKITEKFLGITEGLMEGKPSASRAASRYGKLGQKYLKNLATRAALNYGGAGLGAFAHGAISKRRGASVGRQAGEAAYLAGILGALRARKSSNLKVLAGSAAAHAGLGALASLSAGGLGRLAVSKDIK